MAEKIPSWPKVTIRLYDDHNAEVKIAGRSHPVNHHDPRQAAIALVAERSAQLGRPVKATAVESDGASWPLIIHPDGRVEAIEPEGGRRGNKGSKPIWPIIVAAAVACALIAGTTVYLLVIRDDNTAPKPTASPKLPALPEPSIGPDTLSSRPVPIGWSNHASWTIDMAPNTTPAVSPDGTEVAVVTPDSKLVVLDANGKVLWQDTLPDQVGSPVYTTIDSKRVVAITTEKTLYYWAGDGALPDEIELPNSSDIQFFGTSPLVQLSQEAGASVVSGGELKAVPNEQRDSTVLLAEGDKALMARYSGEMWWSQPGKDLKAVTLQRPAKATKIDHVVAASPGQALVVWQTANPETVIPTVNSTTTGNAIAICPSTPKAVIGSWEWVPGTSVSAWGDCLINLSTHKTYQKVGFSPLSITGTAIYGNLSSDMIVTSPGGPSYTLAPNTARPWGVVGSHVIVVHNSVVYALDKAKS